MVFHKCPLFLARHSQKLALGASLTALAVSYAVQPYYEVFARWALIKTHEGKEVRPSQRIRQIAETVYEQFNLSENQRAKLDVFLVGIDQSTSIGSISSGGYAFIGVPFFASYSDPLEITTEEGRFYTRHFPHGPYSAIGIQLLDLVVLSEPIVRFMIARELVRLGAKPKNSIKSVRSARTKSLITLSGMICGAYLAYQVSYALNRALRLPARVSLPARLLCYTALTMAGLFCQWQVVLAWRRRENFLADLVVAQMDPSLLQAGLIYYDWRLRYNRFCYDRALDRELVKAKARVRGHSTPEYDPIQAYQDEQSAFQNEQLQTEQVHDRISHQSAYSQAPIKNDQDAIHDDKTGYFFPRVDGASENAPTGLTRPDPSSLHMHSYKIHPRLTACGNERWAADGDALAFGFTELLSLGYVWPILARFLSLFGSPATSEARLNRLKTLSD